jgi:hypothetical protein
MRVSIGAGLVRRLHDRASGHDSTKESMMFTAKLPESYPELEISAAIQRIQDDRRLQRVRAARRAFRREKVRRMLNREA